MNIVVILFLLKKNYCKGFIDGRRKLIREDGWKMRFVWVFVNSVVISRYFNVFGMLV